MLTKKRINKNSVFIAELELYETTFPVGSLDVDTNTGYFNTLLSLDTDGVLGDWFEAYPMLMFMPVHFKQLNSHYRGFFSPSKCEVVICTTYSLERQLSTLVHELQHVFQLLDNRPGGTNVEYQATLLREQTKAKTLVGKWIETRTIKHRARRMYENNQGEIEARLAQARNHYTPEELATIPWTKNVSIQHRYFNAA